MFAKPWVLLNLLLLMSEPLAWCVVVTETPEPNYNHFQTEVTKERKLE